MKGELGMRERREGKEDSLILLHPIIVIELSTNVLDCTSNVNLGFGETLFGHSGEFGCCFWCRC